MNRGDLAGWVGWAESVLVKILVAGSMSYLEVIELLKAQSDGQPDKVDVAVIRMGVTVPRQLQQLSIQGDDMETHKNEWMWWGTKEVRSSIWLPAFPDLSHRTGSQEAELTCASMHGKVGYSKTGFALIYMYIYIQIASFFYSCSKHEGYDNI